eukprot:gene11743-5081_t
MSVSFTEFDVSADDVLPQSLERIRQPIDDAMYALKQIIAGMVGIVVFVGLFLPLLAGTTYFQMDDYTALFELISPYLWAALGIGFVISLSVVGAAWGIYISAATIMGSVIRAPQVKSKNIISVIFCEAVAVYGLIMAIIMSTQYINSDNSATGGKASHPVVVAHAGYTIFSAGLIVGVGNVACGISVGIIGAALVIADAANSSTFIKILVVEIFASALSIFSVIVGIVVATQAHFNDLASFGIDEKAENPYKTTNNTVLKMDSDDVMNLSLNAQIFFKGGNPVAGNAYYMYELNNESFKIYGSLSKDELSALKETAPQLHSFSKKKERGNNIATSEEKNLISNLIEQIDKIKFQED